MRRLLLAVALAAALPVHAEGRLQRVLDRGRLIVGVKLDYPPWGMVARDGGVTGLEPDLARDLADRLGVGLTLVPVTGANRLPRLEQGQIDVVIATMGDTPERRKTSDLLLPHYFASGVRLMTRGDAPFRDWGELRGRRVCLSEGAFYNRALAERWLIDPVVFAGNRDALMALKDGRCVGWAFDDSVLARILAGPELAGYRLALPAILGTPWAIAVARGEGDAALGRFVTEAVADWHRSGRLIALEAKWGLPPSGFLAAAHALWSGSDCARDAAGGFPAACLGDAPARAGAPAPPGWATRVRAATGLDLAPFLDPFGRGRLVRGVGLTLALSLAAILGSLAAGAGLAWGIAAAPAALGRPLRGFAAVCRMTPPLLQLYLVFFGFGGLMAARWGHAPGSFLTAALVLSLYAGGTNAALLSAEMARLAGERPGTPAARLLLPAADRCYDGLAAASVNIVKAAGLASTIALPEVVSATGTALAEGADPWTTMNLLVVFYFLFVLAVLALLGAGRRLVRRGA